MQFRAHAGTILFCCLALLLATGLYQRVANPSLEYHLDHPPAPNAAGAATARDASPATGQGVMEGVVQRMSPEDRNELVQAMAGMRENQADPAYPMRIAAIFMRHEDWHTAVNFMERAVRAAPDDTGVLLAYARALLGHKEFQKAGDAFERALDLDPKNTAAMGSLVTLYRRELHNPARAETLARNILAAPGAGAAEKAIASQALGGKP